MLRGLYSVAGAMEASAHNQEIIADNLANAVTPGYRRQGSLFDIESAPADETARAMQNFTGRPRGYSNFESGPIQRTNNPYDLAIVGNAFFVVEGPNGPLYTRNGSFERSPEGELTMRGSGYRVSGIRIPPEATSVAIAADGVVRANGAEIGRVPLATFDRLDEMRRVGPTLFSADGAQTPAPGAIRVEQGCQEGSNVQPVREMVSMMLGMRHYEAAEKALRALSDAVSQNTRAQQ